METVKILESVSDGKYLLGVGSCSTFLSCTLQIIRFLFFLLGLLLFLLFFCSFLHALFLSCSLSKITRKSLACTHRMTVHKQSMAHPATTWRIHRLVTNENQNLNKWEVWWAWKWYESYAVTQHRSQHKQTAMRGFGATWSQSLSSQSFYMKTISGNQTFFVFFTFSVWERNI